MTQYNTFNVKLSNSQLSKLKSETRTGIEVTLNLSSNVIGNCNDEEHFPYRLLLTGTQVTRIRITFANGISANIKFLKNQLSNMVQLGRFLIPDPLVLIGLFLPVTMINSIANSYEK